jgi:tetratricopeptide (TPR) repeat protein
MTPEAALEDLLSRWQDLASRGQAPDLAQLCRDHPELLPELERRISALQRRPPSRGDGTGSYGPDSGAFPSTVDGREDASGFDSPPTAAPGGESTEWLRSRILPGVPGYEILDEIGRGGMGVVYKARQVALNRVVALKMILHADHAGDDERQRFMGEAEAIAMVKHPGIVQIHDFGSHEGLPFFALEFCPGGSLHQKLARTPLPPAEAARVVEAIARAIGAAHQAGVLHRDLKPGNVLIDEQGAPRVTDFGLARRVEGGTDLTQTGAVVGTPAYMAPEQARGEKGITAAADVYSLGAILYECLTGRPPFKAATTLETLQQVVSQEPVSPRQLNRGVPRDLETITLKCLSKAPNRRYASAEALAGDLKRYLNGEPVTAQPPSVLYLAGKFALRHRAPLATAAAALVLLVAGTALAFVQIVKERNDAIDARNRADEEERKKGLALQVSEANRKLAEKRFNEKRQAMDDMLAQFSEKGLSGMPGTQQIRKVMFERGVGLYEGIFREKRDDLAVQLSLADRYAELGRLQSEIGTLDKALAPLKKAEKVLRGLVAGEPRNPRYRYKLGVILYEIGYCSWQHRKPEVGLPPQREAIGILAKLSASDPKNFDWALQLAQARTRLAASLTGRTKERLGLERLAWESLDKLVEQRPGHTQAAIALARIAINRGSRALATRKYREAERFFTQARRLAQRALAADPNDPVIVTNLKFALVGLSGVYGETNRAAKGIQMLGGVVEDLDKLATANPDVLSYQQSLVWAHDEAQKLYQRIGEREKATASLQEIVRICDALAQRDPQNFQHPASSIQATLNLAESHRLNKRQTEAAVLLDRVVKQAELTMRLHPTSDILLQRLLKAYRSRGEIALAGGQSETARASYQGGVELFARHGRGLAAGEETHYNYLLCCSGLLQIAREKKETAGAIDLAGKLIVPLKLETFTTADSKQQYLGELIGLAGLYEDVGRVEEAVRLRLRAVAESKKVLGGNPRSNWYVYQTVFNSHQHLARLYRKLGDGRREFEALRNHLKETESYVSERDHSAVLAETKDFTPRNLSRLREVFAGFFGKGMKRFTIPVDFAGVKYPFHFYVADSWPFLEDQFTWVEKWRGGKVPPEVVVSFRRLYQIARQHKVSFQDLCVYALSTGAAAAKGDVDRPVVGAGVRQTDAELIANLQDLERSKKAVAADKAGDARRRLALRYAKMAEDGVGTANYYRASHLVGDALEVVGLDSFGRLRDPKDAGVYSYVLYVQGAMLAGEGKLEQGYARLMESMRTEPGNVAPDLAVPAGSREFALGWTCLKLGRPVESATWYHKALARGHPFAAARLYRVHEGHPQSTQGLPDGLGKLFARAKAEATKDQPAPAMFASLVGQAVDRGGPDRATLAKWAAEAGEMADHYAAVGQGYLSQKKADQARDAFRREEDLRNRQIRLGETDDRLRAARARAIYHLGRANLELGQAGEAALLFRQAAKLESREAVYALAELYEQGKGVAKDAREAVELRAVFPYTRGCRLYDEKKYALALEEFERSVKELPVMGNLWRLGWCQRKLGRYEDAVASMKRGLELAPDFRLGQWLLLDLIETSLCANKPAEAFAALALAGKRKWDSRKAELPHTYARELAGLGALALHMAGKGASGAEKQFEEIASQPNMVSSRTSEVDLTAWLKGNPPEDRRSAVKGILASLAIPMRELDSPYFPIKEGASWVYKASTGGQWTVRARRDREGERSWWLLETVVNDKVIGAERLAVEADGIYRQSATAPLLRPALRILPLPPRSAPTWKVESRAGWFAKTTGQGRAHIEAVTVPAGTFSRAAAAELKLRDSGGQTVKTVWYARGVGPVKIVVKTGKGSLTLELEKTVTPP